MRALLPLLKERSSAAGCLAGGHPQLACSQRKWQLLWVPQEAHHWADAQVRAGAMQDAWLVNFRSSPTSKRDAS